LLFVAAAATSGAVLVARVAAPDAAHQAGIPRRAAGFSRCACGPPCTCCPPLLFCAALSLGWVFDRAGARVSTRGSSALLYLAGIAGTRLGLRVTSWFIPFRFDDRRDHPRCHDMSLTLDSVKLPRGTLGELTLQFDTGVHVLTGPNGIGKTSLLNAIAGSLPLVSGRIAGRGKPLDHRTRRWCWRPTPARNSVDPLRTAAGFHHLAVSAQPRDAAYADAGEAGFGLGCLRQRAARHAVSGNGAQGAASPPR
jgi:hypothetical protein